MSCRINRGVCRKDNSRTLRRTVSDIASRIAQCAASVGTGTGDVKDDAVVDIAVHVKRGTVQDLDCNSGRHTFRFAVFYNTTLDSNACNFFTETFKNERPLAFLYDINLPKSLKPWRKIKLLACLYINSKRTRFSNKIDRLPEKFAIRRNPKLMTVKIKCHAIFNRSH